jgi:hypothetical protein
MHRQDKAESHSPKLRMAISIAISMKRDLYHLGSNKQGSGFILN